MPVSARPPVARALASALGLALAAQVAPAQSVIRSIPGAAGERLGAAIVDAGDANGDGWRDYLVGAPNANGGRGGVVCISGKYLATALGPQQLYSFYPSAIEAPGDAAFGWSIAKCADATNDSVPDYFIGAPYSDVGGLTDAGAVYLLDGATHALTAHWYSGTQAGDRLGWSLAPHKDLFGSYVPDVLVGAPGANEARDFNGVAFVYSVLPVVQWTYAPPASWGPASSFGFAMFARDVNNDGIDDFAISAPDADNGSADRGVVRVYSGGGTPPYFAEYWGAAGQEFGITLTDGADFDGDGYSEFLATAASGSTGALTGEVFVLSLKNMIAGTPPFELFTWDGPAPINFNSQQFGASLAPAPDLNGDAVSDVLVGIPRYGFTTVGSHGNRGAVAAYSGRTGARIGWLTGADNERIGSAVLGTSDDLNGDGFADFVLGGASSSVPSSQSGVFKAASLFPTTLASTYCIGKLNSLGCTPAITSSGYASTNVVAPPFQIGATNVINNKNGLLFYGRAPLAIPFQGGVKCVAAPTIRTVNMSSGGNASGNDCSGSFTFDFNAWLLSGVDPSLGVGDEIFCQWWSRDPASASTTSLSNALSFVINP